MTPIDPKKPAETTPTHPAATSSEGGAGNQTRRARFRRRDARLSGVRPMNRQTPTSTHDHARILATAASLLGQVLFARSGRTRAVLKTIGDLFVILALRLLRCPRGPKAAGVLVKVLKKNCTDTPP